MRLYARYSLTGAMFFLLVAFFPGLGFGETRWFTCTVEQVGPGLTDNTNIMLTDVSIPPSFAGLWFQFRVDRREEMLAVAMTALVNNLKIRVQVDPTPADMQDRIIQRIYLIKKE